jgi:hypothetical protein
MTVTKKATKLKLAKNVMLVRTDGDVTIKNIVRVSESSMTPGLPDKEGYYIFKLAKDIDPLLIKLYNRGNCLVYDTEHSMLAVGCLATYKDVKHIKLEIGE